MSTKPTGNPAGRKPLPPKHFPRCTCGSLNNVRRVDRNRYFCHKCNKTFEVTPEQNTIYRACESLDLEFRGYEVDQVVRDWNAGVDVAAIARKAGRKPLEVGILIADLAEQGQVDSRENGVYGMEAG
jgi:hypothetical protein